MPDDIIENLTNLVNRINNKKELIQELKEEKKKLKNAFNSDKTKGLKLYALYEDNASCEISTFNDDVKKITVTEEKEELVLSIFETALQEFDNHIEKLEKELSNTKKSIKLDIKPK